MENEIEAIEHKHGLKDYHAFIYWFIETTFGHSEERILNSICDGASDKGIDAVIVDPIEFKVIVIQSKFERAGGKVHISENDIKLLATVKDSFRSRKSMTAAMSKANKATRRLMNEAFEAVRSGRHSLELIFISTHKRNPHLDDLVYSTFGFAEDEFRIYHYDRIMQLHSEKMRDFTPSLGTYHLPFVDEDKSIIRKSTHKSWVFSVRLSDIQRLAYKYKGKLFRKNVRNFLGKSRTNKGIAETLRRDPFNFWYFNNGITILCERANIVMEKGYVRLENPQVVNGCQTVMSIQEYDGLLKGELMVRVVESTDQEFVDYLTLYQNSSNRVRNRDLKSNDPVQIRLKHELGRRGYYYEIKRGEEYSKMAKEYPALKSKFGGEVVNNELVAKLLAAVKISPSDALKSGSDKFFGDYYDQLFTLDISTSNCLAPFYLYDIIKKTYRGNTKRFFSFEKDWVFKNRALFLVLAFLYRSMRRRKTWERDFVEFYDHHYSDPDFNRFYGGLEKVVNPYFRYIYGAWDRKSTPYWNTYLQGSKTMENIVKKYKSKIKDLDIMTKDIFDEVI